MILILCSGILFAQQEDSTYIKLGQDAQAAYNKNDYKKSIQLYLDAIAHPASKNWRGGLLYNVSCDYSLLGLANEALTYLQQAIDSGYTDYRWISKDTDFDFLRKKTPKRFNALVAKAKTTDKNARLIKSPIAIVRYDNYSGPSDISKYIWDDFNNPQMDSLREKYHLAKIIENGKTEFEKMKLLLNWVSTRWKHNGNNTCKEKNALAILAAADKGEQFACIDYAITLANCMTALGYPARWVGLRMYGEAFGNGKGHSCIEVWSNQFQKWILLDGQNNAWWESGGVPLNAHECRQFCTNDKEDLIKFIGQFKDIDYNQIKSEWDIYFYHLVFSDNNSYFSSPRQKGTTFELISDSIAQEIFLEGFPENLTKTNDIQEIYPRLNQTVITVHHVNTYIPSDTIIIKLTHTMPFFQKFLVRINGSELKESIDEFPWILKKGENAIEVKAVNLANIEGKVSRIVLRNNIGFENK
jgi:hypothetical protein